MLSKSFRPFPVNSAPFRPKHVTKVDTYRPEHSSGRLEYGIGTQTPLTQKYEDSWATCFPLSPPYECLVRWFSLNIGLKCRLLDRFLIVRKLQVIEIN